MNAFDIRIEVDDTRFEIGNYFKTREEAESVCEKIHQMFKEHRISNMKQFNPNESSKLKVEGKKDIMPPIKYHPKDKDELKEIVKQEIKKQGGVNIDLRMIDVSRVEDMSWMFYDYQSLKSLDLSNWDVSSVKNLNHMFSYCYSLKSLDLSRWDVSNVKNMDHMFDDCPVKYKKEGNKLVRI